MKLVTYAPIEGATAPQAGLLWDGYVLDAAGLLRAAGDPANGTTAMDSTSQPLTLPGLLGLEDGLSRLQRALGALTGQGAGWKDAPWARELRAVSLKAPIQQPPSLRDFYAFEDHVRNARARRGLDIVPEWYEFPVFYFSNPNAIFGPDDLVHYPPYSAALDYELEVACVIGRRGMNIQTEEAEDYIAGFTIMNDWSARDEQQREMRVGLGPAKGKDFATSLGPWLVTPDELEPRRSSPGRYDLAMKAWVNGKQYSSGNFKDIYWTFGQMIARASHGVLLHPGDVIGSGTVGTGCILELGSETHGWLQPGDRVELEVEGLGRLCNVVGPAREGR